MNIDPGWQDRIWVYHYRGEWLSVDAVLDGRKMGKRKMVLANPYTFPMLVRRYMAGKDVPTWAVEYIERELGIVGAA